jgi:hypothetical protein
LSTKGKLRILSDGKHGTFCPGCQEYHIFDTRWTFDGNYEQPTFFPSLKCSTDGDEEIEATVCHSYLTAGVWHFLGDSTHALANQAVPARDESEDWCFAEDSQEAIDQKTGIQAPPFRAAFYFPSRLRINSRITSVLVRLCLTQ